MSTSRLAYPELSRACSERVGFPVMIFWTGIGPGKRGTVYEVRPDDETSSAPYVDFFWDFLGTKEFTQPTPEKAVDAFCKAWEAWQRTHPRQTATGGI